MSVPYPACSLGTPVAHQVGGNQRMIIRLRLFIRGRGNTSAEQPRVNLRSGTPRGEPGVNSIGTRPQCGLHSWPEPQSLQTTQSGRALDAEPPTSAVWHGVPLQAQPDEEAVRTPAASTRGHRQPGRGFAAVVALSEDAIGARVAESREPTAGDPHGDVGVGPCLRVPDWSRQSRWRVAFRTSAQGTDNAHRAPGVARHPGCGCLPAASSTSTDQQPLGGNEPDAGNEVKNITSRSGRRTMIRRVGGLSMVGLRVCAFYLPDLQI